jgi:hypothetical protein
MSLAIGVSADEVSQKKNAMRSEKRSYILKKFGIYVAGFQDYRKLVLLSFNCQKNQTNSLLDAKGIFFKCNKCI